MQTKNLSRSSEIETETNVNENCYNEVLFDGSLHFNSAVFSIFTDLIRQAKSL